MHNRMKNFPYYLESDNHDQYQDSPSSIPTKPPKLSDVDILIDATHQFMKSVYGCNLNLTYIQLSQMITGIIVTHTQPGAAKAILEAFKLTMDKHYEELKGEWPTV